MESILYAYTMKRAKTIMRDKIVVVSQYSLIHLHNDIIVTNGYLAPVSLAA